MEYLTGSLGVHNLIFMLALDLYTQMSQVLFAFAFVRFQRSVL